MAAAKDASLQEASSHSLVFRVMRLCRPALHCDLLLRTLPRDLGHPEEQLEEAFLASLSRSASTSTPPTGAGDSASAQGTKAQALSSSEGKGGSSSSASGEDYFRSRVELSEPLDSLGLSGLLVLPQSFGSIHLGETFCSYISVGNHASHDVSNVVIKAELQTERHRVVLVDNTASPLERIQGGGRHDFIVEHDIKELGAHTLVCSASYVDFGEAKYLPQYFKFSSSNPLSVKTKVRAVKDQMFLEASIENCGKTGLNLDRVHFDPTSSWHCSELKPAPEDWEDDDEEEDPADEAGPEMEDGQTERGAEEVPGEQRAGAGSVTSDGGDVGVTGRGPGAARNKARKEQLLKARPAYKTIFRKPQILVPNGGTQHFLYCLAKTDASSQHPAPTAPTASPAPRTSPPPPHEGGGGTLGRLEISWRATLGEPGRLQTQQILGNPVPRKEIELKLLTLPERVFLEHPFLVDCQLANHTDRTIGPLRVVIARDDTGSTGSAPSRAIVVSGPWSMTVAALHPHSTYDFQLCLVALVAGVQRLSGIGVVDARDSKPYDALPPTDLLVEI